MFFDESNLSVSVLDVVELRQEDVNIFNSDRNFCALSFRYASDTVLHTEAQCYALADNTVCFVPAQTKYTRIAKKDTLIAVHFHISGKQFDKIEAFTPKEPAAYQALFAEMFKCWNGKENGYQYSCTALLYQILSLCYQEHFISDKKEDPIDLSVKFLEEHFTNPNITIEEIAEQSFISEVYFRKLFKERYGIAPMKYIIHLRMEYAVNLMQMGYYSLHEVAKLSGYNDYSYFSSEFKRIKGVAPSNFHYQY